MLELVLEFFRSLGLIGYVVLAVLILALLNIRKLILLRSPLDSQQHKTWRATGGTTNPDHLQSTVADALDRPGKDVGSNDDGRA
ncbi:MAG: hypothetical protein F4186_14945 [Boseongicola sp. SB0676_bin_33]|uniref:Uncharacterized protein n=1 Tax=Boseongicola sp. SB0664_bin_43 TaxID=2604844 RepID=A0A6B0XVP6_9RHOB|nr:hypothetical protein [Boseongicola sp. SB0664_bin_43]MYF90497.1 hypothetical protein [Boseongicola sp. SB0676_bin_33]MYK31783.1 hypothetical protein [Boseongicola sp. SB0670_bin_30]